MKICEDPYEALDSVATQADLRDYVKILHRSFIERPEEWANRRTDMYLDAVAAVLADNGPDGFQIIKGDVAQPSWSNLARLLLAGSAYE